MRQSTNQHLIQFPGAGFHLFLFFLYFTNYYGFSSHIFVPFLVSPSGSTGMYAVNNQLLTNLSEGEKDMRSSQASPSRPRLLQLLLFPLLLEREGK